MRDRLARPKSAGHARPKATADALGGVAERLSPAVRTVAQRLSPAVRTVAERLSRPAGPMVRAVRARLGDRRASRVLATVGTLVLIVAAVLALTVGGRLGLNSIGRSSTRDTGAGVVDPRPVSGEGRVPATPESILELLIQLLPKGTASHQAKSADGGLLVQTYLDDGRGPGMVRLGVGAAPFPAGGPVPKCPAQSDANLTCRALPDGGQALIITATDNCSARTSVAVDRVDGTSVNVEIASCLEFDGTISPPGRQVLTADQAVAIAADPRWGRTVDPALVTAGGQHFATLPKKPLPRPVHLRAGSATAASTTAVRLRQKSAVQWVDVNGDRANDYCRRVGAANSTTGRVACTLSTSTGFGATLTSPALDWGPDAGRDWADFNGDNKMDFCRRLSPRAGTTGKVACTMSTGTGFGDTFTSADLDLGADTGWAWEDVNADNKVDYCRRIGTRVTKTGTVGRVACTLSTGTGFGDTITSGDLDVGGEAGWGFKDVNGDNSKDYCRRVGVRSGATGQLACTLFTVAGFGDTFTSEPLDLGDDASAIWKDVTGDDRADYCRRVGPRTGSTGHLACTVTTGSGTGFGQTIMSGDLDLGQDAAIDIRDVDGDKKNDFCRRVGRQPNDTAVACTLSTGTGFGSTITSSTVDWGQDPGAQWVDFNNDHKHDYCRRIGTRNGVDSKVACTLSTGTGFASTVESPVLDWGLDN